MNSINQHTQQLKKSELINMQDLIDGLLVEKFFGDISSQLHDSKTWQIIITENMTLTSQNLFPALDDQAKIWQFDIPQTEQRFIVALQKSLAQGWQKVSETPVYVLTMHPHETEQQAKIHAVSPLTFMDSMFQLHDQIPPKAANHFLNLLEQNLQQLEWSQAHKLDYENLWDKHPAEFFRCLEQWASLKDRPYHPLAKAKTGLNQQDYQRYMAEFAQKIPLSWIAVHQDVLMLGEGINQLEQQHPSDYFLCEHEQLKLKYELKQLNIDQTHIALPVHPWQYDKVIQQFLPETFASGHCVALTFQSAPFYATSSLRSMAPDSDSASHLKLPMDIYSLCSSRYLPAIKMVNGQKSQRLLALAQKRDPVLDARLWLCDESIWWAYLPENTQDYHPDNETLYAQAPRQLAAMLRDYPKQLFNDPNYRLIPMASLATVIPETQYHFFDDWLKFRNLANTAEHVRHLFKEVCTRFYEVNLRLFGLGMVGEVHGQNVALVWENGHIQGVLFRDHDALRVCVPMLEANGLPDPEFSIKRHYPNTLYNASPKDLFFFFQTLGIHVNLRAIIDSLVDVYEIQPEVLWNDMAEVIQQVVTKTDLSTTTKQLILQLLLKEQHWPFKMLLTPMFDYDEDDPGSMPFDKSEIGNPFLAI